MNRYYEAYPKSGGTMLTLPPPPLSDPSATWNSYSSEPVKGLGNRSKPDRNRQAVNVQKLQWRNSN